MWNRSQRYPNELVKGFTRFRIRNDVNTCVLRNDRQNRGKERPSTVKARKEDKFDVRNLPCVEALRSLTVELA